MKKQYREIGRFGEMLTTARARKGKLLPRPKDGLRYAPALGSEFNVSAQLKDARASNRVEDLASSCVG
jgi:hypothetical protein